MQTQRSVEEDSAYSRTAPFSTTSGKETAKRERTYEQHLLVKRDWYTTGATFLAGGIAGACSRTLTAPLDRIKVIVQEGHLVHTTHKQISSVKSDRLIDVFNIIRADGGWRAFWRGNTVNSLKAGPEFAIVFTLRRYFLSLYEDWLEAEERLAASLREGALPSVLPPPLGRHWTLSSVPRIFVNFYIGACAGMGAQLVLYPLEVVKTRIVVSRRTEFQGGIAEVAAEAYRSGGVKEFYRGLAPTMVGVFLYRGLEVGVYSTVQQRLMVFRMQRHGMTRHEAALTSVETAVVGMVASILAQTISYPLNVVRTRLQTQGTNGRARKYNGMVDCFAKMIRTKGVASLFSGLTANYLKAVPASTTMFVVFEKVQKLLIGDD